MGTGTGDLWLLRFRPHCHSQTLLRLFPALMRESKQERVPVVPRQTVGKHPLDPAGSDPSRAHPLSLPWTRRPFRLRALHLPSQRPCLSQQRSYARCLVGRGLALLLALVVQEAEGAEGRGCRKGRRHPRLTRRTARRVRHCRWNSNSRKPSPLESLARQQSLMQWSTRRPREGRGAWLSSRLQRPCMRAEEMKRSWQRGRQSDKDEIRRSRQIERMGRGWNPLLVSSPCRLLPIPTVQAGCSAPLSAGPLRQGCSTRVCLPDY